MFARTVEWHHTPLNICSSALPAQLNWQLKTYGPDVVADFLKRDDSLTKEGSCGLQQQQQHFQSDQFINGQIISWLQQSSFLRYFLNISISMK